MIGATVKTKGIKEIIDNLSQYKERSKEPFYDSDMVEYMGSRGHKNIMRHFDDELGPRGKWKPLTKSTLARREAIVKILQVHGIMRGKIIWNRINTKKMGWIAADEKANTHNYGRPPVGGFRSRIPKRQFMWFSNDLFSTAVKMYKKYVLKGRPT